MKDFSQYSDLFDILFKLVGVLVALYIAPIKKSISTISDEMKGLQGSVNELNKNMAIIFEKHDAKEKQIENLIRENDKIHEEIGSVRSKLHDLGDKASKMDLNEMRIQKLEGK
jgi:chromosome segregation ATPase